MADEPTKRRVQFGIRTLLEVIAVAAFVLALIYFRDERTRGVGRYQLLPSGLVIDTKTGSIWEVYGENQQWRERMPPIPERP